MIRLLSLIAVLLALLPAAASAQPACEFKLGFKALRDQIPDMVGQCLEDEHFNVANGNAEQRTTAHHGQGGLLVWRKADNWTAFTDGYWTWVNGPNGVQKRLNSGPLFPWEAGATAQEGAPPSAAAPPSAQWARHDDPEKSFQYPAGWQALSRGDFNYYLAPRGSGRILYLAPFRMGADARVDDFMGRLYTANLPKSEFELGPSRSETINGYPATLQPYAVKGDSPRRGLAVGIQRGAHVYYIEVSSSAAAWSSYEPLLLEVVRSYLPKHD
jgi:hypothetical protein